MGQDSIDLAVARNHVKAGSALERLVRENAYSIFGTGETDDVDRKLDAFIEAHSGNPHFADSLESRASAKVAKQERDTHALHDLSVTEFERIRKDGLQP